MRVVWPALIVLSACQATAPEVVPPVDGTPDLQEGGPVTRVVTTYGFEDGGKYWDVTIIRAEMGATGAVKVIGPGPEGRARFFAAKACLQDGGRFDPAVKPVIRDIPQSANDVFVFDEACA